jgi:hypothetical protein
MEVVELILTNPIVRSFIEGLVIKIVADVIHRRTVDPQFLAKSDTAFAAYSTATTDEETQNALKGIQALLPTSSK